MVKVGDKIRSYDFGKDRGPGRPPCFIEGVIKRIDSSSFPLPQCHGYEVFCTRDHWRGTDISGEHSRIGKYLWVPAIGTKTLFGEDVVYVELVQ